MAETEFVEVFVNPEDMQKTARALLDAAGAEYEKVATVTGGFRVPSEIAAKAGLGTSDANVIDAAAGELTGDETHPVRHGLPLGPDADATPTEAREQAAKAAGVVQTADGAEHVGEVPAGAAEPEDLSKLNGDEIDERLKAVDLPTTGKVDERRARLAEHRAAQS